MARVMGEQLAQVDNPDPFASPVWRSPGAPHPGVRSSGSSSSCAWLWRVVWFLLRHPLLDAAAGVLLLAWLNAGWPGLAALAGRHHRGPGRTAVWRPAWFTRLVAAPVRCRWRWWCYRRHWQAVLTVAGLAPVYRGQVLLPSSVKVEAGGCTDRVTVRLVSGQSPADFADRADSLAHGFRALLCRVRAASPGTVVLELVRRDALAEPMTALPIPDDPDLGRCRWAAVRTGCRSPSGCSGTHLLIAGATGAGKGSYLWGLVRAMLPLMAAGLVQVWACDPKLMELAFGRALFDRHGRYAADPGRHRRPARSRRRPTCRTGRSGSRASQRDHRPTTEYPFVVVAGR